MTSNPGAVGALILVPIAIAGSVAFVAIKTNHFFQKTSTQWKTSFNWPRRDHAKQRRSDTSASQVYADSWYDLESTNSGEEGDLAQLPSTADSLSKPEIARPKPLRIVKERANTIASCSTSRGISAPRGGSAGRSGTFDASPEGPQRSLTVLKRRRYRVSVLDDSLGWNSHGAVMSSGVSHNAALHRFPHGPGRHTETTGQSSVRSKSVGSFLKSELLQRSSGSEFNDCEPYTVLPQSQDLKDTFDSSGRSLCQSLKLADFSSDQHGASETPRRRQSIRKKFVSIAVDGLGNVRSKSMHFLRSKSSKESLLRQISLRNINSPQVISSESSRSSSRFSFEEDSVLVSDSTALTDTPTLPPKTCFILYPEINVIPEIESVDTSDEASIWVAVVLTGALRKTSECGRASDALSNSRSSELNLNEINLDKTDYGHLHGIDITLAGCKGSILESVIAEKIQAKCLRLGQTELTLARVKLPICRSSSSHIRESSKELIAELESCLGNATTEYLSIGISYKHSSFPNLRNSIVPVGGISYQATTIRVEANAILKRHCSQSSWSQQTTRHPYAKSVPNPLLDLINAHYDGEKAARLLTRIIDPSPVSGLQQQDLDHDCYGISSSKMVTPVNRKLPESAMQAPIPISTPKQSLDITQAQFHNPNSIIEPVALNPCNDLDPARKIWSDMRKTSRGTGIRGSRTSGSLEYKTSNNSSDMEMNMQEEQARIIEIALRNKRSLGADTLRSMAAPSMSTGIGVGRVWGWGPPWW